MEKKERKPLKASQKQRRYRVGQKLAFGGEFVSITTPYIIMGAINFDEWFGTAEGWKIGVGGAIGLALMSIAVFVVTKKKEDTDAKTGGYITLLLGWLATAFVFLLLADIIHEIATIMFFGAIGIAGALGLDITSKKLGEKADMYQEALKKVKGEALEQEARREIMEEVEAEAEEEKTTKVKVKVVGK